MDSTTYLGDDTAVIQIQPEQSACPNCGYCQHCGRGGGAVPFHPYPQLPIMPTWPQPYVQPYTRPSWSTTIVFADGEESI